MEWLKRLQNSLDYLEDHLDGKYEMEAAAREACSSSFHFQRMFQVLTGFTVAEYVRCRRLTLAAQELASGRAKVLDVALKYGYETPESFSKAFSKLHGIPPSAAKKPGVLLKACPRFTFQLAIQEAMNMNYKIIDQDAFRLVGKSIRVSNKEGENFRRIPKFWDECHEDGTIQKICGLAGGRRHELVGVCADFCKDLNEFKYMVAARVPDSPVPEGLVERNIPAATWAVFESVGPMPDAIQKVWKAIFAEWFPSTGYEHAEGPELEVYPGEGMDTENYRCEVWIPVRKAK